jgi:hypothetical protein
MLAVKTSIKFVKYSQAILRKRNKFLDTGKHKFIAAEQRKLFLIELLLLLAKPPLLLLRLILILLLLLILILLLLAIIIIVHIGKRSQSCHVLDNSEKDN